MLLNYSGKLELVLIGMIFHIQTSSLAGNCWNLQSGSTFSFLQAFLVNGGDPSSFQVLSHPRPRPESLVVDRAPRANESSHWAVRDTRSCRAAEAVPGKVSGMSQLGFLRQCLNPLRRLERRLESKVVVLCFGWAGRAFRNWLQFPGGILTFVK